MQTLDRILFYCYNSQNIERRAPPWQSLKQSFTVPPAVMKAQNGKEDARAAVHGTRWKNMLKNLLLLADPKLRQLA
jgi:hypothetical protein